MSVLRLTKSYGFLFAAGWANTRGVNLRQPQTTGAFLPGPGQAKFIWDTETKVVSIFAPDESSRRIALMAIIQVEKNFKIRILESEF